VNGSRLSGSHAATLDFLQSTGSALLDVLDASDAAKRNNIVRVLPEFARRRAETAARVSAMIPRRASRRSSSPRLVPV